jgi:hypothetical protein
MGPMTQGRSPLVCIENSIQVRALGSMEKGKIEKQQLMQAQHVSTLPFVAPTVVAEMRKLPTDVPFQSRRDCTCFPDRGSLQQPLPVTPASYLTFEVLPMKASGNLRRCSLEYESLSAKSGPRTSSRRRPKLAQYQASRETITEGRSEAGSGMTSPSTSQTKTVVA